MTRWNENITRLRQLHQQAVETESELADNALLDELIGHDALSDLLDIAEAAVYAENLLRVQIDVDLARDQDPSDPVIFARARLREALLLLDRE